MFLDGADVEKLSRMVKKQAQSAQFIVVSLAIALKLLFIFSWIIKIQKYFIKVAIALENTNLTKTSNRTM